MAGTALRGRLTWLVARSSEVGSTRRRERPQSRARLPGLAGPRAGPACRRAADRARRLPGQRSYSIASRARRRQVALTVERLEDGEVSPYLVDELQVGRRDRAAGPIGGYFVWEPSNGGPLLLIAGGSGVVPLMAMLRARMASRKRRADAAARTRHELRTSVIYRDELDALGADDPGVEVVTRSPRAQPPGWTGYARRDRPRRCWPRSPGPPTEQPLCTCAARPASSKPSRPWSTSGTIRREHQDRALRSHRRHSR